MLWYSLEAPSEVLLMSTHNICIHEEIKKYSVDTLLFGAMGGSTTHFD